MIARAIFGERFAKSAARTITRSTSSSSASGVFAGASAGWMRQAGLAVGGALCRLWSLVPFPVSELVWIGGVAAALGIAAHSTLRRGFWGFAGALCRLVLAGGVFLDLSPVWFVIAAALAGIILKNLEVKGK